MHILEAKGLVKRFGGVKAVDHFDLDIQEKEICSIIGPNGAGKTTLFNLLSNRFLADEGQIFFKGQDITGIPPHKLPALGIGRTFQITNIFPKMTAFENIQAAVVKNQGKSFAWFRPLKKYKEIEAATNETLENIGLQDKKDFLSTELPYGDQRRLEIGIAMANNPEMLLLDEPTAGMGPEETKSTIEFISKLNQENQITILIIEHDMDLVFTLSQNICVMHQGALIAYGKPEEIAQNKEVTEAYMGGEE